MKKTISLVTILVLGLVSANAAFGWAIDISIADDNDDVEERLELGGVIDMGSGDLELAYELADRGYPQVIGLRFTGVTIPKGALITAASVQFQVDEIKGGTEPVNVVIEGELAADAAAFANVSFNVSSRARTTAQVQWSVPNWTNLGDHGPDQATTDLAAVIQEIVNQDGWASGNALVLIISDDPANPSEGIRCAVAGPGDDSALLHIEFIEITDPDLLIYYDFESGAGGMVINQSDHNHDGLFMGNPEWAEGIFGGCVAIDIADLDYIQTEAPLNIVSNTVTVTGWVKHDESPAAWSGILTHRGTEPGCLGLQHNGTELRYMWGADVYWDQSSGLVMPNGEWYFAALAISPDQGKLYLNGIEQTFTNIAPHVPTNFDSLIRVGRDHNDDRIMTSLIDEVRFYNRTLTDVDIQRLVFSDVITPRDNVVGVPDDGDWPGNETPDLAIDDNTARKYLHFKGDFEPDPGTGGAGFRVTPTTGPKIVTGLTLTTANDVPGRDPIAFELYGSNDSIDGPYELIASGDIVDFAQEAEWPRFTMNETPISFDNDVAYAHYQVVFTAIRGPVGGSVNSMQIAEVELLGVRAFPLAGLVAHWKLDDGEGTTAVDSSGNGNDGILIGDPQRSAGVLGGALQFDGIDDYISTDFVLNPAVGAFSVFAWIKGGAPGQVIISQTNSTFGSDSTWLGTDPSDGKLMTELTPPPLGRSKPLPLESEFTITDGQWYHIGLVWDGSYRYLYVDGTEVDKDTTLAPYPITSSNGILYIGAGKNLYAASFFSGLIDDVQIYNEALTPDEISEMVH